MENRDRLIDVAAEAIEDVSLEGLTVREVARRAKQSTIGIYRHFKGKPGLLDALFVRGFERLGAAASAAGASGRTAREAVLEAVDEYLALARSQPQHYRLMFAAQNAGFEPTDTARGIALANYDRFVELVERLPGAAGEGRRIATDLFALVHGHVALRAQRFGPTMDPSEWTGRIKRSVERQLDLLSAPATSD
ncbi:TetR/AcrR family transcriptional regulator [Aurantiacibacter aquimixticola]|uniref:TetR/AcrR family transcriptional regulator n=1 Tax=Aurantiacibacter aquimixticola TaxID=1958945 RepID=A0A419RR71_9SPHN|nr:TetR/AcrR family transcriptional regulator [Aurantiacibacter aquimixticola]RJY08275.1 TetR/AcrR family transcriptional regulator [Aurantiacibacter aquimixticola]